ncbi:hypothetical protein [Ornithinimicrobium pekingense]|nr:hypothetical protein [Ornithinimicrobium pekingense]
MSTTTTHHRRPTNQGDHDVRNAWLSMLLLPVVFFGAFLVGEGLIGLLGYPVGDARPPLWAGVLATVPALAVFALPAVLSSWFAARASRRRRDRRGWVPAGILVALAVGFTVLNTVPMGQ